MAPTQQAKPIFRGMKIATVGAFRPDWTAENVTRWIEMRKGEYSPRAISSITHLLCTEDEFRKKTPRVKAALLIGKKQCHIVKFDWLEDCMHKDRKLAEDGYSFWRAHMDDCARERDELRRARGLKEREKFVDTYHNHIYVHNGLRHDVTLTRNDGEGNFIGERYVLCLYESNAKPHLYQFAAKYYKKRNAPVIYHRPHDTGKIFEEEMKEFTNFFRVKTGIEWNNRMDTVEGKDKEKSLFRYQPPKPKTARSTTPTEGGNEETMAKPNEASRAPEQEGLGEPSSKSNVGKPELQTLQRFSEKTTTASSALSKAEIATNPKVAMAVKKGSTFTKPKLPDKASKAAQGGTGVQKKLLASTPIYDTEAPQKKGGDRKAVGPRQKDDLRDVPAAEPSKNQDITSMRQASNNRLPLVQSTSPAYPRDSAPAPISPLPTPPAPKPISGLNSAFRAKEASHTEQQITAHRGIKRQREVERKSKADGSSKFEASMDTICASLGDGEEREAKRQRQRSPSPDFGLPEMSPDDMAPQGLGDGLTVDPNGDVFVEMPGSGESVQLLGYGLPDSEHRGAQ